MIFAKESTREWLMPPNFILLNHNVENHRQRAQNTCQLVVTFASPQQDLWEGRESLEAAHMHYLSLYVQHLVQCLLCRRCSGMCREMMKRWATNRQLLDQTLWQRESDDSKKECQLTILNNHRSYEGSSRYSLPPVNSEPMTRSNLWPSRGKGHSLDHGEFIKIIPSRGETWKLHRWPW